MDSIHPLNYYVKTVIVVLLFEESPPGWALMKVPSRAASRKAGNYVAEPNIFRRGGSITSEVLCITELTKKTGWRGRVQLWRWFQYTVPNTRWRRRWSPGTWHRKRLTFIFQYPGPIPTNSISSAKNLRTLFPLPETTVDTRRGPPPGAKFVGRGTNGELPAGANQVRGHLYKLETNLPIWVGYWLQVAQEHSLTNPWALGSRV